MNMYINKRSLPLQPKSMSAISLICIKLSKDRSPVPLENMRINTENISKNLNQKVLSFINS